MTALTKLAPDESEDRAGEIEHHNKDQLQKQKDGKGHWKQELSSNSEAAVGFFFFGLMMMLFFLTLFFSV